MSRLIRLFAVSLLVEDHIEAGTPEWEYAPKSCSLIAKPCGVTHWDVIASACATVGTQSPIDLPISAGGFEIAEDITIEDLKFVKQPCSKVQLIVNTHTSEVNLPYCQATFNASLVLYKGKPFNLESFHWRSPSEHTIGGTSYPMEVQFMHRNPVDNSKLVLSVFVKVAPDVTAASSWMEGLLTSMPWWTLNPPTAFESETKKDVAVAWGKAGEFSPHDFFQQTPTQGFYVYDGSYTTPECDTSVTWIVAPAAQSVTQSVLNKYRDGINQVPPPDSQLALLSEIYPNIATPSWAEDAWVSGPSDLEWKNDLKVNIRRTQAIGSRKLYQVANSPPSTGVQDATSSAFSADQIFIGFAGTLLSCCCLGCCAVVGFWLYRRKLVNELNSVDNAAAFQDEAEVKDRLGGDLLNQLTTSDAAE